jgi:hypothetical protein
MPERDGKAGRVIHAPSHYLNRSGDQAGDPARRGPFSRSFYFIAKDFLRDARSICMVACGAIFFCFFRCYLHLHTHKPRYDCPRNS